MIIRAIISMEGELGQPGEPGINIIVVDSSEDSEHPDPFAKLRKHSDNIFNQELFDDDQFKLPEDKLPRGVIKRRLRDIYRPESSLEEEKGLAVGRGAAVVRPSYVAELRMLPQWHFLSLIEPKMVNEQGFYHVAVVQSGRIAKIIVDDWVYYDEVQGQVVRHPLLEDKPWVHVILKAWAKLNKGYDRIQSCEPFSFIKAFSFPDWALFNPGLQELKTIISKIGPSNTREFFYVGKTKSDPRVGLFGLLPNCAAYLLTGYHQEYGNVFVKVKSFCGERWNECSAVEVQLPSETIPLGEGEFLMPMRTFVNLFHLVYYTTNKYSRKQRLHYNKHAINLDARESKASLLQLQINGEGLAQRHTTLNFYFPSVKPADFGNPKSGQGQSRPPSVKICVGRVLEQVNMQGSMSYAQSLRETILKNEQGYFLNPAHSSFEHVTSDYFRGYANEATYHLKLKPGRYLVRVKVEKLLPQYRALLNVTSSDEVTISEVKPGKKQQSFLSEVLSDKARKEERNVIYPFPHKKQTWIMANDDFDSIGYGSLTFQTGKSDALLMAITIDFKKLKQGGYRLKNKTELSQAGEMKIKQGESMILVLKRQLGFQGKWIWPPQGISVSYQAIIAKPKHKKL